MEKPQELASRYCENLGMSVILCRDVPDTPDTGVPYRCLSAHLCGDGACAGSRARADDTPKQPGANG